MLDIHCHILPAVDDGSPSKETTLTMAGIALRDGITEIICTPHCDPELDETSRPAMIARLCAETQALLDAEGMSALRLSPGAEWMLRPGLEDRVAEVSALGGYGCFLFELSPFMPPDAAVDFCSKMRGGPLTPILAHPERYPWCNPKAMAPLAAAVGCGAVLQLTGASLTGLFGKGIKKTAETILRTFPDCVVIASDAHDPSYRIPVLTEAYRTADKVSHGAAERCQSLLSKLFSPTKA